jgi:hypothetical protein
MNGRGINSKGWIGVVFPTLASKFPDKGRSLTRYANPSPPLVRGPTKDDRFAIRGGAIWSDGRHTPLLFFGRIGENIREYARIGLPGPPRVSSPREDDRFAIRGACEFRKRTARKGPTRQARGRPTRQVLRRAQHPERSRGTRGRPHRFGFRAMMPKTRCGGTKASRSASRTPTPDQCGGWRI